MTLNCTESVRELLRTVTSCTVFDLAGLAIPLGLAIILPGVACAASPAADASAPPASADSGGIQEIVVTAQKRAENIQKVPLSVVAISGETLQNRGIRGLTDLGNSLPGLQIESNSGVALPFLRGVGNSATSLGNESSVAVYLDGVYFARRVFSRLATYSGSRSSRAHKERCLAATRRAA